MADRPGLPAAALEDDELEARVLPGAHDLLGAVRAAVRRDDDLEKLGRVVLGERVLELGPDHGLLVPGGEEDRDAGTRCVAAHHGERPRTQAAGAAGEPREEHREPEVPVEDEGEREPEERDHADGTFPEGTRAAVRAAL